MSLRQAIECEKKAKERLRATQGAQTVEVSEVTRRAKTETDELTHSLLVRLPAPGSIVGGCRSTRSTRLYPPASPPADRGLAAPKHGRSNDEQLRSS